MPPKPARSSFGTIEVRKRDDKNRPTRYRPKYKVEGYGFQIGPTVHTYGAAEDWLRREELLHSTTEWTPVKTRKAVRAAKEESDALTVAVWLIQWLDIMRSELRASTWQNYERTIKNRITEIDGDARRLAGIPLADLTARDVARWWDAVTEQHPDTRSTNRKAYGHLRSAVDAAMDRDENLLDANPVNLKAARKRPASKSKELPTAGQLQAIVDHIDPRYKLVAILCLFCGLRLGEALAVKRRHLVSADHGYIVQVRANLQRVKDDDGRVYMSEQPPKTKAGRRDVPVLATFTDDVQSHLDLYAPKGRNEYVTQTRAGRPVMDTSFRSMMERARARAGISETITPHYGRNWLITHLAESGATPAEIGHLLGQSDLKTITEIYMKVRPDRAVSMMERINASL